MPGFQIHGYGGLNADAPVNTYETRRKHRWFFKTIDTTGGTIAPNVLLVLKEASRPNFQADEPEMHHNQEVVYFAGKHKWDPCKLVWYDVENPDSSLAMWKWVTGVINLNQSGGNLPVNAPVDYKKDSELDMLDGKGNPTEQWFLYGCWPKDVNWNTLDYGVSDIMQIEVNMRFDRGVLGGGG